MKRFLTTGLATAFSLALIACGGADAGADSEADTAATAATPMPPPAPAAAPAGGGTLSDAAWVTVDDEARTVTIDLVAGQTDANNHWNYNGHTNGDATVVVPEGYEVTINFSNEDPVNFHSAAILEARASYPAMFDSPSPVFEGAITSNATSMTEATASGESETITFTAGAAGNYALVCLIPAHATQGMWIGFEVSGSGESGVRM